VCRKNVAVHEIAKFGSLNFIEKFFGPWAPCPQITYEALKLVLH
jgi:hypothetical protein